MWVRSYWRADGLVFHGAAHSGAVLSRRGIVYLVREPPPVWGGLAPLRWERINTPASEGPAMPPAANGVLGFGHIAAGGARILRVPWWSVLASAVCLSLLLVRKSRRAARASASGLCPACGYDLRATPERCPECGTTALTR